MNFGFVFLGAVAAVLGMVILVAGIRGRPGENPKATAQLIGGIMLAAFGLLMAGFSIGYSNAEPLEIAQ